MLKRHEPLKPVEPKVWLEGQLDEMSQDVQTIVHRDSTPVQIEIAMERIGHWLRGWRIEPIDEELVKIYEHGERRIAGKVVRRIVD